jgi:uncharacterized protein (DUF697 family)
MNYRQWFYTLSKQLAAPTEQPWTFGEHTDPTSSWRSLLRRNSAMMEVEDEVATEQQGRLVMVGRCGELSSLLLAALRQQAPLPVTAPLLREGFFTLLTLDTVEGSPAEPPNPSGAPGWEEDPWPNHSPTWAVDAWDLFMDGTAGAELLLYLFSADEGWQPADARWCARLRALGIPILPVLMIASPTETALDGVDGHADVVPRESMIAQVHRSLGIRPITIHLARPADSAVTPEISDAELHLLVRRILSLRPRLAIPLAQESPRCRSLIARRIIRSGALVAALVGSEPLPLLDIPLQVAVHWKVVLQLAAIYGRPGLEYRSRELLGTVGLNLSVRFLAQQAIKAIPLFGWLASGLLSGCSVALLGHTVLRSYEQDEPFQLAQLTRGWRSRMTHLIERSARAVAGHVGQRRGCWAPRSNQRTDQHALDHPVEEYDHDQTIPITCDQAGD